MRKIHRIYISLVNRREDYIGNNGFMILLAIIVGIFSALAAAFLKIVIHFIESDAVTRLPSFISFFLLPLIGIFIVVFIYNYVFPTAAKSHGIVAVLDAIKRRGSLMHYTLMYAQMITGAITMSFGGSSGLESPTVVTGSAIGSNAARFFRMDYKFRTLFIGCGTAGTIAAIFNAPIAGVIFATEVILPQFSATIFIPILISSATGAFFAKLLMGGEVLFKVRGVTEFTLQEFPLIIVLGVLAGFVSLYYTRLFAITKELFSAIRNKWKRALVGGILLGSLIFLFPLLFGEGYLAIRALIQGKSDVLLHRSVMAPLGDHLFVLMGLFGLLIILKPLAAVITVHSGGEGGQFAPSFVTGGFVGFFFYLVAVYLLPQSEMLNPINYILLGMAAVLAGVMHAPLTGIFLIAEITESYDLFIGLMIVTAIAFFTKYYFDRVAFHFKAEKSGGDLEKSKHEYISLNNIKVSDLVDKKPIVFNTNDSIEKLIDVFANSDALIFGVKDDAGNLVGIITNHQLRKLLNTQRDFSQRKVGDICTEPVATVSYHEQMDLVVTKFDLYDVDFFPVVNHNKLIGFISRLSVMTAFREALNKSSDFME